MRREYHDGRCQDCGHDKRVTVVTFWVTGMRYRLCAACVRVYGKLLLK